jgi:phage shock protein PspC (stress-responsive transcriptional regulator)
MKNDPKAVKVAWIVWGVFIAAYLASNLYFLKSETMPLEKVVLGFGIAMPIISNLAWWAVGFRLRFRISYWWAFGFLTAFILGISGFATMWAVAKSRKVESTSSFVQFDLSTQST